MILIQNLNGTYDTDNHMVIIIIKLVIPVLSVVGICISTTVWNHFAIVSYRHWLHSAFSLVHGLKAKLSHLLKQIRNNKMNWLTTSKTKCLTDHCVGYKTKQWRGSASTKLAHGESGSQGSDTFEANCKALRHCVPRSSKTDRQTDRQTDRHRQTDTDTDRQTDRQTQTENSQ